MFVFLFVFVDFGANENFFYERNEDGCDRSHNNIRVTFMLRSEWKMRRMNGKHNNENFHPRDMLI